MIGDFFVPGIEKPTHQQTIGIRAIRNDLIEEVEPYDLVFKKIIPFAVLTLWTVKFTIPALLPTGAFVSAPSETAQSKLGVIRFNHAKVQEAGESFHKRDIWMPIGILPCTSRRMKESSLFRLTGYFFELYLCQTFNVYDVLF